MKNIKDTLEEALLKATGKTSVADAVAFFDEQDDGWNKFATSWHAPREAYWPNYNAETLRKIAVQIAEGK